MSDDAEIKLNLSEAIVYGGEGTPPVERMIKMMLFKERDPVGFAQEAERCDRYIRQQLADMLREIEEKEQAQKTKAPP